MEKTPTAAVPSKKHTRKFLKVEGKFIIPDKKHTHQNFKLEGNSIRSDKKHTQKFLNLNLKGGLYYV